MQSKLILKDRSIQAPVAHTYNPSYLGGRDKEDQGSKPAWADNSQDSISNITRAGLGEWLKW
jgi:hypothetical protein